MLERGGQFNSICACLCLSVYLRLFLDGCMCVSLEFYEFFIMCVSACACVRVFVSARGRVSKSTHTVDIQ